MKVRILFIFLLINATAKAQNDPNLDKNSSNATELQLLAQKLTQNERSELAKVRSIFNWITESIDYRVKHTPRRVNVHVENLNDTSALRTLDERVAETVYASRMAVCDGYSRLFKTLCGYAGIEAAVITGYGRVEFGRVGTKFRSNHTWNAVRVDSVWHLLDVTWATGHLTWNGGEFVRRYDGRYFLTDPRTFIHDHYPDDLRWTLMDNPPSIPEFKNAPYKQRAFIKYKIKSFSPARGVIEANVGDTLRFSIYTDDVEKDKLVSADPFLDTASMRTSREAIVSSVSSDHRKFYYEFVLGSHDVQWIYLMYNGDIVLRYQVHIKDRIASK